MRYDILLLDADETLMDFPAAERQALQRTFADHGLTFTQATDDLYQQINQSLWRQFERGEITRPQLLATRFAKLFESWRLPASTPTPSIGSICTISATAPSRCPTPSSSVRLSPRWAAGSISSPTASPAAAAPPPCRQRPHPLPQRHLCLGGDRLPEAAQGVLRLCLCPHPRLCKIARPDGRRLALLGYGRRAQRRSGTPAGTIPKAKPAPSDLLAPPARSATRFGS